MSSHALVCAMAFVAGFVAVVGAGQARPLGRLLRRLACGARRHPGHRVTVRNDRWAVAYCSRCGSIFYPDPPAPTPHPVDGVTPCNPPTST